MNDILNMTVHRLIKGLNNKEFSSREITEAYCENIRRVDGDIGAYITERTESACQRSSTIQRNGNSLFQGIPIAIKDNFCTKSIRTTCGSRMLDGHIPVYDADAVKSVLKEGMIILGKTNMDEFGMGDSGENSAFFKTKNPIDKTYSPGGSSSGSAAAVASRQAPIAIGSDTGGSIRLPSSFCGTVGLKPSYGRISRRGLISFAPSLDCCGIISKDVLDSSILLSALSGYHGDMTCTKSEFTVSSDVDNGIRGMTVAIPKSIEKIVYDPDILLVFENLKRILEKNGAKIIEFDLFDSDASVAAYYVICCSEAASNLARFDCIRFGNKPKEYNSLDEIYVNGRSEYFGNEVKKRITLGNYSLSYGYGREYYSNAVNFKNKLFEYYRGIFASCHAIMLPVSPSHPFLTNEKRTSLEKFKNDRFNIIANLGGFPSISLPCGRHKSGMPISLQFMGNTFDESTILRIAKNVEGELK